MTPHLGRGSFLKGLIALPCIAVAARAEATDYASAAEVFDSVDRLEADVEARLRAIAAAVPAARAFVQSLLADYSRHRARRVSYRLRLRLPAQPEPPAATGPAEDVSLAGLHAALEALVYAHAEGMPALGDAQVVDGMAHHMVDLSRQLTVVDLWIEEEQARG